MAMVKQGDCLHNCLKEVHLEKFHRNFIERGLTNCDQLGCLPMDQYSQFGVVSMEDRKRLFSIIEIIKSVKADGILCQHGTREPDRKPEHKGVRGHEDSTRVNDNSKPTTRVNNLGFAPRKLYADHESRRDEGKVVGKPTNNYKVAVERSAEEDLKQKQLIKHGVVSGKNSDSPMFQCRKALNFSDPDLYSDEEVPKLRPTQDAQTAVKVPYFNSTQANKRTVLSNGNYKDVRAGSGDGSNSSRVANGVGSVRNERLAAKGERTGEAVFVSQHDRNTAIPAAVRTRKTFESGRDVTSSRSTNALPQSERENHASSGNNNISSKPNPSASNVSSATAFSSTLAFNSKPNSSNNNIITKEFVTAPKHFAVDLKPTNDREKTIRSLWQHPSKANLDKNHAYFPAPEPVSPFSSKPMHVEQIIHSGGYNYGVPDGSSKTQNATPQTDDDNKSTNGILYPDKIRVCVRKRPRNAKELKRNDRDVVRIRGQQTIVVEEIKVAIDLTKYIHQHVLKFDEVFGDKCNNQEIYERAVKPLISCVFDKGSAICFAFGQTGAGKTHTLMGSRGSPGMYQLAGEDLFAVAHSGRFKEPLRLWVSFYEIYLGHLYDLLNKRKRLHVRENGRQKVCVAGLMENPVPDIDSLIKVISYGNSFRSRGSTGVNPHSSRSHALLQMDLRDAQEKKVGRLTFIDLAGSERASDATNLDRQTRIEGAEINQSLLALKECIRSIDQETCHTPYRQSKLTHILRDSFLGNSQTVMIANVSPTQTACENTLNTLRYADRVQELRKEVAVRTRRSNSPTINGGESHTTNAAPLHGPSPSSRRPPAPSLFHPSDIQFSSTPLKTSAAASARAAPPVDLSEIFLNGAESPIGGHKISEGRKSRDGSKERLSPVAISPIGELVRVEHGDDRVESGRRLSDGVAAAADGRCEVPVFSERRECSQESNPIGLGALPCTCKSEEDLVSSKDVEDELMREHRRIKTQAEEVISRVRSVMEQAALPHGSSGPSRREVHHPAPHVLFMETKTCMENARDNIRDFLDNEKRVRVGAEPGLNGVGGRPIGELGVWAARPDSLFRFADEVLPDETDPVREETKEKMVDGNTDQMGNVNGSNCGSGNLVSAASDSNPTKELPRSWAEILQDSTEEAGKMIGGGVYVSGQQPGLGRNSVENGGLLDGSFEGSGVENSGEAEDDVCSDGEPVEDVPSFVVSKEVRLLQMKIQELKLQKSRLEREQRLFDAKHENDLTERFTENFPSDGFDSKSSAAVSDSVRLCLSPGKESCSIPDNADIREAGEREIRDKGEVRVDPNGKISLDQNGNSRKFSSRDFPTVGESLDGVEHSLGGFKFDRVKSPELSERSGRGEGKGQVRSCEKEMGSGTHDVGDAIHISGNKVTATHNHESGSPIDNVRLKFPDELASQSKPSLSSQRELSDVKILCDKEDNSLPTEALGTEEGSAMNGKFSLHQNSAFTKVKPSINDSSNNSQDVKPTQTKEEPLEITSTVRCLSLPISDSVSPDGFEPIESFPVTPRIGSESEMNVAKEWSEEDGSSSSVDKSNSELSQENAVLERTRTLLVTAHEDQLTAVTHLCKQEMSLLMAFRTGQMDYDKYMESIRDILRTKSKIIEALVEHINEFHRTALNS